MGGSVHSWERGLDPWHIDAFPEDLQPQMKDRVATGKRKSGWYALDAWGNEIGFVADGTLWEEHRPSLEIQVIAPLPDPP